MDLLVILLFVLFIVLLVNSFYLYCFDTSIIVHVFSFRCLQSRSIDVALLLEFVNRPCRHLQRLSFTLGRTVDAQRGAGADVSAKMGMCLRFLCGFLFDCLVCLLCFFWFFLLNLPVYLYQHFSLTWTAAMLLPLTHTLREIERRTAAGSDPLVWDLHHRLGGVSVTH